MTAEEKKPVKKSAQTGKDKTVIPKSKKEKTGKPMQAFLAFIVVLVQAILLLSYPFTLGQADALGVLFFIFGLMMIIFVFYVFKVEYWSWSSVLIVLILVLLLAVPSLIINPSIRFAVIVSYGVLLAVVLFFVRKTYGVGVWKLQQMKEKEEKKIRDAKRTANPEKLRCPRCASNELYITEDGSTFCTKCKVGYVDIHDVSATPKTSL